MDVYSTRLIEVPKIGEDAIGYLSFAQSNAQLPFVINRVYWTYHLSDNIKRGGHAHIETESVLFCLNGEIKVTTINKFNKTETHLLNQPNIGIYLPKMCWRDMEYKEDSVQMVIASTPYVQEDYIRDFDQFKRMIEQ